MLKPKITIQKTIHAPIIHRKDQGCPTCGGPDKMEDRQEKVVVSQDSGLASDLQYDIKDFVNV